MGEKMKDQLINMRKRAGLSQQVLADRLYVSRSTVARWENGAATPSIDNLEAMAKLYHISLDQLCEFDEVVEPQKTAEQFLVNASKTENVNITNKPSGRNLKMLIIAAAILVALVIGGVWLAKLREEKESVTRVRNIEDMNHDDVGIEGGDFSFEW